MERVVVVGAAIVRHNPATGSQVLAARRRAPARVAGFWEFPGGKVEPGETEPAALVRECREELGVTVEVLRRVGDDVLTGPEGPLLRVWHCRVVAGTPIAHEHDALRWLSLPELGSVPWIPADAPIVRALEPLMR